MTGPRSALLRACAAAGALLAAGPGRAALGEPASSVASDAAALGAARGAVAARGGFSVEEIETGSAKIREYVSPSGVVFAIAWNGLAHPDLAPLLGRYAAEYRAALRSARRTPGHRRLRLPAGRIVVEKWGHMRDLRGRAWAPALVPPGVELDAIR